MTVQPKKKIAGAVNQQLLLLVLFSNKAFVSETLVSDGENKGPTGRTTLHESQNVQWSE